jgi:integrase
VARRRRRPAHGYVVERPGKTGTAYAIWYRFNGKRIYHTLGRSQDGYTRQDADRELQNLLGDINRGHHQEVEEVTFEQFASDWYHRHEPEWAPKTARSYRDTLELHLSPYFGDYLIGQLVLEHVDAYKAHKLREGRLSRYSINKSISLLSSVLEDAVRYRLIASNPARQVKRLKTSKPEGHYLEPFQVGPFLDATPGRHRTLFELLIRAGLRIGEATALKWGDIDMHRTVIVLRRTISAGKVRDCTKSGDSHAVVRLTPELVRLLADWQLREHDDGRGGEGEWVFPSEGGAPLDPDNLRKRVLRPAVKAANKKLAADELPTIPEGLTLHDLRRSCCSLLFASGAQLPEVMERMRHRDERMTLCVYAKVMQSRASDVDAALDELLASNKSATKSAARSEVETSEATQARS